MDNNYRGRGNSNHRGNHGNRGGNRGGYSNNDNNNNNRRNDNYDKQRDESPVREKSPVVTVDLSGTLSSGIKVKKSKDENVSVASRPQFKAGTQIVGNQIQLVVNHFAFTIGIPKIHQYAVQFEPEIMNRGLRMKLISSNSSTLGIYRFDGQMLFTPKEIPDQEIQIAEQDGRTACVIKIFKTKELSNVSEMGQLVNIFMKKILYLVKLQPIGRQHFDPTRPKEIPQHKIKLWPGYFTSILPTASGLSLAVDFTHKVIRTDSVLDFLYDMVDENPRGYKDQSEKELNGQTVLTKYNNTNYRLDGIDWTKTPETEFSKEDKVMTFKQYYQAFYGLNIQDLKQPLLVYRRKRRGQDDRTIYLVPEFCQMTGLSDKMKADMMVMKDVAQFTRVAPKVRQDEANALPSTINNSKEVQEEMKEWKISISNKPLEPIGRQLPPEEIFFKGTRGYKSVEADWKKANRDPLIVPININNWVVICTNRNGNEAGELIDTLRKVGKPLGINVSEPKEVPIQRDDSASFIKAIDDNVTKDTQLVVCILPNKTKSRYDDIKTKLLIKTPVPSQCVVAKSLQKNTMSVVTKILFQINVKLGGQLWRVDIPLKKTMVIGVDVCHDTLKGGRSVVGFVASINDNFTRYYSRVKFQASRQEVVDGIQTCITGALRRYFKENNSPPDNIIIYRDGVGDGQLQMIMEHEIAQYRAGFKDIDANYNPKLVMIIVQKRIHLRMFTKGGSQSGNISNPPPGTVLDNSVTYKHWYDFYLVAQAVNQGSVTPTHYHVVLDELGLRPDLLQMLTFKLCHLYYNWSGTIRVPAPCQYAHKIAFLMGQSVHADPHESLADMLYYL